MSQYITDYFENPEDALNIAQLQAKTDWEIDFVADLQERFAGFGERTYMSVRQADMLQKIIDGTR